jgi:predicted DCC family thiol-disulfide oxidoreductase YuxK
MIANNKVMVYDDNCPLCNAYTSAFVKIGLLETNGRKAFSQATDSIMCKLDTHKSKNEIPLLDTVTNQTWYGLDAMLEVISVKFPLVKRVANIKPIKWFLQRIYKLISYNRKVIVAVPKTNSKYDCTPDFNAKYRLVFLLFVTLFTIACIKPLYYFFNVQSTANTALQQVYLGFGGLFLVAFVLPKLLHNAMSYHYWGQIAMVSLLSLLLTLPLLFAGQILLLPAFVKGFYLLGLLAFMIKEIRRRITYLHSVIDWSKRPLAQLK